MLPVFFRFYRYASKRKELCFKLHQRNIMTEILTAEQELLMSVIRDEWIKVPFDTSLVNKEKAEAAINVTYESLEETKPKEIIWFNNPLDAVLWMIDNLDYLYQFKYVPNAHYRTGRFSVVSHQITWEDDLTYNINRNVPHSITQKFEDNFDQIINSKYLHWLSQSFLADFLNSYLRHHLLNL